MKIFSAIPILLAVACLAQAQETAPNLAMKQNVVASIERDAPDLIALNDQIWAWAETALTETRSAAALADYAEAKGFRVERGVAGMPTAFVASYGRGKPIIGVMGEFDALPGLSQTATATQGPLEAGAGGHGCGHNLFGVGKVLGTTMVDLYTSPEIIERVRTEFERSTAGQTYQYYIPDGPPPLPEV